MYNIAIVGGGVAGLVTASGAAQFGAKVALVEKGKMGGDCLNYGCVPTKGLVHSAKIFHKVKNCAEHGITIPSYSFDFKKAMDHMRSIQADIAKHDDPERFRKMGVDVFLGDGKFVDSNTFEVNGDTIKAKKFLIATGSRPVKLPIPGLDTVDSLNNETILELNELPESLIILGAGPIGMEYAQIFSRFGTKVTVIEKMGQILPREEKELAEILEGVLKGEGIDIQTCIETKNIEQSNGKIRLTAFCQEDDCDKTFVADKLFAAIGRAPNVEGLNLENIGVTFDRRGIKVDDSLRTSVPHIYAAGDVTGMFPFTHMAEYEAGIVISNALFPVINRKMKKDVVPWCTYTDPELARVGLSEDEAVKRLGKEKVKVYRYNYKDHDRAKLDGATEGMVKLVCNKKGIILGAHIVGAYAGDLLHEYVLAMNNGLGVQKISQTVHVYPTMGQIVKRAADQYYREKLFSGPMALLTRFLFGKKQ